MRWPWNSKPHGSARRQAELWEKNTTELMSRMNNCGKELEQLQERLEELSSRLQNELRNAGRLEEQHRMVVESLRAELQVSEGTVEALELGMNRVREQLKADVAYQGRRQVAYGVEERGEQ